MTPIKGVRSRAASLVLALTGVLTMFLSVADWSYCPTTPCGGMLMAVSEYSWLDLGFGIVTYLAGLVLAFVGADGVRRQGRVRFPSAAVALAVVVVVTAGASVIWMYGLPADDKDFTWPPTTAVLVGIVGLIALGASVWMRRRFRERLGRSGGISAR